MDHRSGRVVKPARVPFERLIRDPAEEDQREDRRPQTKQQ